MIVSDLDMSPWSDVDGGLHGSPKMTAWITITVVLLPILSIDASSVCANPSPEDGGSGDAASQPTDGSHSPMDASESPPELAGTWAQKLVQTAVTDVPVVGESTTKTITYLRVELDQSGETFELDSRVCDVVIRSDVDMFETIVPEAFVEALPQSNRKGRLMHEDGEIRFQVERRLEIRGAQLRSPEHEYLPEEASDSRVVDPDNDGHPGLTLRVDGVVSGEIYVVQRGWDRYTGRVVSEDRMTGQVEWDSEQNVLDSTSLFIGDQPPTRPHPDDDQSHVEFVRIDEGTSCSEIASNREELF